MPNLNSANNIKGLLVDFLIKQNQGKDYLLGSELFFGSKKRLADVVILNGLLTGFEIKSKTDDFRRTREQLNDYMKVFDIQILVTTKNHEKKAEKILMPNEGLIVINDCGDIEIKKKPKPLFRQEKREILETIPIKFLRKNFQLSSKFKNAKEIRDYLADCNLEELKKGLRNFLSYRLAERNKAFIKEKGKCTHYEDLWILKSVHDQID